MGGPGFVRAGEARGAGRDEARPSQADCRERFISFASGGAAVRGILTLPSGDIRRTVLFLGGWSGDRQGPHRLFLLLAHRLAGQGTASLRIDYRGRGGSDGHHAAATIATMAADAEQAVGWLRSERLLPCGLDVVAICSGCKVAIALATRVEIRHMDLLSAEAMGSLRAKGAGAAKTAFALHTYARKLFRRETWRKILRGEVRTGMVGKALVRHEKRSADEARAEDAILARFRAFRGDIRFVHGGSDPDAPGSRTGYEKFCRKNAIPAEFHIVPDAGHSYYALDWTECLFDILGVSRVKCRGDEMVKCKGNETIF
jgi:pimeloyl-ACP methyl ester carboxylesterase